MFAANQLIDTDKYPLFSIDNEPAQAFRRACRKTYREQGALALAGFILPAMIEKMAIEAADVEPLSFKQIKHHNVYLAAKDEELPDHPPRNRQLTTTNSTIADVDIQASALLRTVYGCKELHDFIAFVTGKTGIFPYVDALSPLNIGILRPGETLAWHFDTSEFATTLLLQTAEDGGEFEYIPQTRTEIDPAYSRVKNLLDGDDTEVEVLNMDAGTLVLFQGRNSQFNSPGQPGRGQAYPYDRHSHL